jgi:hypothetical protein
MVEFVSRKLDGPVRQDSAARKPNKNFQKSPSGSTEPLNMLIQEEFVAFATLESPSIVLIVLSILSSLPVQPSRAE